METNVNMWSWNYSVGGTPDGIKIHAVFISKSSGKVLKKYAGHTDVELWILPAFENSPWSIMAVSFISLLAMSAMLGTCFFVCKHHVRRERPRAPQVPEFQGMSCHLVKAMPSLIFTTVLEDNCTSRTCAICLEDYNKGEKLRILPCCHSMLLFQSKSRLFYCLFLLAEQRTFICFCFLFFILFKDVLQLIVFLYLAWVCSTLCQSYIISLLFYSLQLLILTIRLRELFLFLSFFCHVGT